MVTHYLKSFVPSAHFGGRLKNAPQNTLNYGGCVISVICVEKNGIHDMCRDPRLPSL